MKRFGRAIGVVGALLLCVLIITQVADERTWKLLTGPNGIIESGDAFGVTIGDERRAAIDILERTFSDRRTKEGGRCLIREFSSDHQLDAFSDTSWRHGTVCIASRDGKVVAIIWMFNPFMP